MRGNTGFLCPSAAYDDGVLFAPIAPAPACFLLLLPRIGPLPGIVAPGPKVPAIPPTSDPTAGLIGGNNPCGPRLVVVSETGPGAEAAAAAVAIIASYSFRATKLSRSRESRWCLSCRVLASLSNTFTTTYVVFTRFDRVSWHLIFQLCIECHVSVPRKRIVVELPVFVRSGFFDMMCDGGEANGTGRF